LGALQEGKTKIEVGTHFGTEASEKFATISTGLELTQPANIILQFSADKPEEAKEGILAFFTGAIEIVSAMGIVPPNINLEQIKITAATDDKHVRIGIQMEHEMLAQIAGQVDFFANVFLEGALTGSLNLAVHLNTSVGDLVSEDSTILDQILKGGSVAFDLRLPHMVSEFGRNILIQNAGSLPPQVQVGLDKLGPALYMRKADVQFDFDTGDAWGKALGNFVPPFKFAEMVLPQLQSMNIPEMAAMTFPPLADFLEIAENHLNSDLKIYVRGPQSLAHVHLKSEGLGKLWSSLKQ